MTTVVYTDGACSGNPGPGGWAWAIPGGRYAAGPAAHTTNQRMEIQAVLEALKSIEGPVTVVADSTYVLNCFRDRWWEGWIKRGWLTSAKKPVANRDLWEPLVELVRARGDVSWEWVKGHSGNPMNDLVDALAVEAGKTQKPTSGEGTPPQAARSTSLAKQTSATPAKQTTSPTSKSGPSKGPVKPDGHLILVVGHKPPELGGYGPNEIADKVKTKLAEIIAAKAELNDDVKVVTGLSLGAEQLAAEAALQTNTPFVAVLPYPEQESVWPAASQNRYRDLLEQADAEVLLQSQSPTSKQAAGGALNRRNAWLSDHVDEAIVVWNGRDANLERFVHTLQEKLAEENVWIVSPD
jgi:ribonuclease HI/uncharacterized phage-like protein YoqJ